LVVASGEKGVRWFRSQSLSPRRKREGAGWRTC
jgi:hypothetical protein